MRSLLPIVLLPWCAAAQAPPAAPVPQVPGRGTQQTAPAPMPGDKPVLRTVPRQPGVSSAPLPAAAAEIGPLTLETALTRARTYGQQYLAANIAAQLAAEDRVQAHAALFPTVSYFNQMIYTQPNGTPSGVFVANDGPHVYNSQLIVHGDIWAPGKRAEYQRTLAAEAAARARADVAARGLVAVVVQGYYGLVSAEHKNVNAQQSLKEAQQFLDVTQKQERGGEVAHSDVVKAQILVEQRQRDAQEAQLAVEKARVGLGVLLFPNYQRTYSVVDDLLKAAPLPSFGEVQALATKNSPELRAAQATVQQEVSEIRVARSGLYPSLSFDYFYGIDANTVAHYNREHLNQIGSVAQGQLTIPIWTWGAARSKVRQAELRLQQAHIELSLAQRQLLANLNAFYLEAQAASAELGSLRSSMDLSAESLRLTLMRYQSGEATVLEVVDAQTTLAQARNAYDDGLVRYRVALAALQTLTGTL